MKTLGDFVRRIHRDERGAVSLETVLIVGAIALPILIFLIKVGWGVYIKPMFENSMNQLQDNTTTAEGQ